MCTLRSANFDFFSNATLNTTKKTVDNNGFGVSSFLIDGVLGFAIGFRGRFLAL